MRNAAAVERSRPRKAGCFRRPARECWPMPAPSLAVAGPTLRAARERMGMSLQGCRCRNADRRAPSDPRWRKPVRRLRGASLCPRIRTQLCPRGRHVARLDQRVPARRGRCAVRPAPPLRPAAGATRRANRKRALAIARHAAFRPSCPTARTCRPRACSTRCARRNRRGRGRLRLAAQRGDSAAQGRRSPTPMPRSPGGWSSIPRAG